MLLKFGLWQFGGHTLNLKNLNVQCWLDALFGLGGVKSRFMTLDLGDYICGSVCHNVGSRVLIFESAKFGSDYVLEGGSHDRSSD